VQEPAEITEALRLLADALARAESSTTAADARMLDADAKLAGAQRMQDRADLQRMQARTNADAYHRAPRHYMRLVRHRIANPLHIIEGMAQTLLEQDELTPERRRAMLTSIVEQAQLLGRLTLFDPTVQSVEEDLLRPRPTD